MYGETIKENIPRRQFWQRHGLKLAALAFWLGLSLTYALYAQQHDITLLQAMHYVTDRMTNYWYGPLLFVLLYAARPLLFLPATPLTLLSGFLFGPLVGLIATAVGSNSSAMLAYFIGRYFGRDILNGQGNGRIHRYAEAMRRNSFEAVLLMRLLFLPYDLVNYLAGFLKISWQAFLAATLVGSVPGTTSFVLLGASFGTLDELLAGDIRINPVTLLFSALLVAISLIVSRWLKKKQGIKPDQPL